MDNARDNLIPAEVESLASTAREVLLAFSGRPSLELVERLRAFVDSVVRLEFHCPPATVPKIIVALLESGHAVFEAGNLPPETQIFFDRRHAFRLPDWTPLPDPFGAACQLAWRRTAAFVRVRGTVMSVETQPMAGFVILRLSENPALRLSVLKSLGAFTPGQSVTLLGRHDFNYGLEAPLLECVAVYDHGRNAG